MKIIAFVGMPAAGKSVASDVVKEQKIDVVNMGDVIRDEVKARGLEPTDANTGGVANDLRDREGMDAVAKRCVPKIEALGKDLVVVDGVRGIAEVIFFKDHFGEDFTLVFIDAPLEMRFERVSSRGRSDDMTDIEALKTRDERELGWGLAEAIKVANITVENTSTIDEFKEDIKTILENA
ncbi:dephospho-CoA kinase [Methanococcoides methylutens]|uniref:Dephospho-CoA kinase archaeal, predicted n=1 Tax=Methanococcoides methylutens MM1 TaxID=1434104 RepID=A0A0E3SPA5_METMT|nr:dephospho-CoA kinase [Methanococcoides methylutens]AKB84396.1 Dephospho-CoA kinase archaeal, predicted [Methanococcoides methylutens MM1]